MKTLRCQLFPASWIKKNKRIRKHKQQKETRWMPVKFQNRNPKKQNQKQWQADLTQTRTHRPPDPDRKHFKCLRFHSQLKCECSRLRKREVSKRKGEGKREEKRGKGKLAAIYSISAASLTVAISYVWQDF